MLYNDDSMRHHPMDVLVDRTDPHQFLDFLHGVNRIGDEMARSAPDVVFFPQRGAGPISWVLRTMIESDHIASSAAFVELPIGTHTAPDGQQKGLKGSEKTNLIEGVLDAIEKEKGAVSDMRFMLIDEVQKGGTITAATQKLRSALRHHDATEPLAVIAAVDSRIDRRLSPLVPRYTTMLGDTEDIHQVSLPLFTVDCTALLDCIIVAEQGAVVEHRTIQNVISRKLFGLLTEVIVDDAEFSRGIEEAHRAEPNTKTAENILDMVTEPAEDRPRTTPPEKLLGWLSSLYRQQSLT